ncbi:hypothetical protein [Thiomicrorhabdus aquaedulcis]|uniref:hypothetical protein n=1 Tax=Thiomicrorhabdus aquaedulcis TaxID=2211106 RepID=UPI0015620399|nr:hypothetical protein [Thiomicrorhabdus aquaedulcis]
MFNLTVPKIALLSAVLLIALIESGIAGDAFKNYGDNSRLSHVLESNKGGL